KRRGGCGINRKAKPPKRRRRGGQSGESASGLNRPAEPTTPAAPLWNGYIFLMARPTPPFQGGEIISLVQHAITSIFFPLPAWPFLPALKTLTFRRSVSEAQ